MIEAGWDGDGTRLEIVVEGDGGRAVLRDGAVEARPSAGRAWTAALGPLDAGRSSAAFLAAMTDGGDDGLATAPEAARIDEVLEALRTAASR